MNKILIGISTILAFVSFALFLMYRTVSNQNVELRSAVSALTSQLSSTRETLREKMQVIEAQNKKYQEIIASIEYNDCENLPVSTTLVEAAKELQK